MANFLDKKLALPFEYASLELVRKREPALIRLPKGMTYREVISKFLPEKWRDRKFIQDRKAREAFSNEEIKPVPMEVIERQVDHFIKAIEKKDSNIPLETADKAILEEGALLIAEMIEYEKKSIRTIRSRLPEDSAKSSKAWDEGIQAWEDVRQKVEETQVTGSEIENAQVEIVNNLMNGRKRLAFLEELNGHVQERALE